VNGRLGRNNRDERFADRINAETEAFKRERANQNEVLVRSTEHDGRRDVGSDEDFRGGYGLGDNHAVGILDAACAKGRDADLFEEPAWDLGEIGARVHEAFKLKGTAWISWIAQGECHVKGSRRRVVLLRWGDDCFVS